MRFLFVLLVLALSQLPSCPTFAAIETRAAIDGTTYAVVAPLYTGATGPASFIRFYNGSSSSTTFNITVVNTSNGITAGTGTVVVPAYASPQYPVLQPSTGDPSVFGQAGVTASSGATYALYIQNSNALAGFQHVTFNSTSLLFENNSVCTTPISQQLASSNKLVLTNVHSSTFASNYPSSITIHNYASTSTVVTLTLRNAATGASIGSYNQTISANGTLTLPETMIESQFAVGTPPLHFNLEITKSGGGTVPVTATHTIYNSTLKGDINMAEACAVNAVAATVVQAPQTTPTSYCGTLRFPAAAPFPYNVATFSFTATIATNGRIHGTAYANYAGVTDGATMTGTLTGTNWTAVSSDGLSGSGTVQNGVISGAFSSPYGNITVSGTTSACSS